MTQNTKKKYQFQAETKQLLHLMIHSLYSNKEIFIRELISNAADAIDKVRFKCLSENINKEIYSKPRIRILIEKTEKKITISDNGIGMTKDEIIQNLGMIAHSGTRKFLKMIDTKNTINHQFIGNFGVGFYSSFIVSKKVVLKTKHIDEKQENYGFMWESEGKGEYFIKKIKKKTYGTDIELYLKDTEISFLENTNIKNIIQKYANHISIPIEIQEYNQKDHTVSWKKINHGTALWTKNKSMIQKNEYENFYKNMTNDINKPLDWIHSKVEGTQEYTCLLYIPSQLTWNILDPENKKCGLKLYVKQVYITDDANQFLPNYLRFIKGILNTNNLPLNISREILQDNHNINIIKSSLTKRVLKLIQSISLENNKKYQKFWKEFGSILKEGIAEDIKNQEIIASLLRFTSIKVNSPEQNLSLMQYVENMHEKQKKIYFLTAENYASANSSPHLEVFRKNQIDVLLLSERIDDWMMHYLTKFKNKEFQSINKIDEEFENLFNQTNKKIEITEEIQNLLNQIQQVLEKKIASVKLSKTLIHSPAILIRNKNTLSPQMSKLFLAAGQTVPETKYIFEINATHPIIKKMINISKTKNINTWIQVLFDQALLSTEGSLKNPNHFIKNINQLLTE